MPGTTLNEDNINSLCKKYFTPELCAEPVTESKTTLERKLWIQLQKLGTTISRKYSSVGADDREDIILNTISECFKNWRKSCLTFVYSAYFSSAVKRGLLKAKAKHGQQQATEISLDTETDSGSGITVGDTIADKTADVPANFETVAEAKKRFKFIDYCFRMKKRTDWLKGIVTVHFYDDLHLLVQLSPDLDLARFSFVDMTVYNWNPAPSQKQIAGYFGKDEGQLSKALKKFLALVEEQYSSRKGVQ